MNITESINPGLNPSPTHIGENIGPDEADLDQNQASRVAEMGKLLENYPETLLKYVVGFGVNRGWTPFHINKVALSLFYELRILIPNSVGKDPIISPTQTMLHRLYDVGKLAKPPEWIYESTKGSEPIDLKDYEEDLDFLYSELKDLAKDNFPYLRDTKRIRNRLGEIGDPKLGKTRSIIRAKGDILAISIDEKYFARYDSNRYDYYHPAIIRDLGNLQQLEDLDSLFDLFVESKKNTNYSDNPIMSMKYLESKIQTIFRQREKLFDLPLKYEKDLNDESPGMELKEAFRKNRHPLSDHSIINRGVEIIDKNRVYPIIYEQNKICIYEKIKNSRMTFFPKSVMKNGKVPFVVNYYYLEFLRDAENNEPFIFEKNGEKFILALGKMGRKSVHPSWVEICIFNVNKKDDREIRELSSRLEQFMVGIIAGRFELPLEWMENILRGKRNLKYRLYPLNDEATIECFGKYGCEVYSAVSCEIKDYLNFPMKEEDICLNLKRFVVQSISSLLDPEVSFKITNHEEFRKLIQDIIVSKDIKKMELDLLETKLYEICKEKFTPQKDNKRPLLLSKAFEDGFNCEQITSLSLYIMTHFRESFPEIKEIKVCYLPIDFMQDYFRDILIKDSHLVLIIEFVEEEKKLLLFDPTGLIQKSDKAQIINYILNGYINKELSQPFYVPYKLAELEGVKRTW